MTPACRSNDHAGCFGCDCICHDDDQAAGEAMLGEDFVGLLGVTVAPAKPKRRARPKDIGTAFTTGAIRYLQGNGFPRAELRNQAGSTDKGDIINCIGLAIECKGGKAAEHAHDKQVADWLVEAEVERVNAGADYGILIMKRAGYGRLRAESWWAVMTAKTLSSLADDFGRAGVRLQVDLSFPVRMHLGDAIRLIRAAGYGQPLDHQDQA